MDIKDKIIGLLQSKGDEGVLNQIKELLQRSESTKETTPNKFNHFEYKSENQSFIDDFMIKHLSRVAV